MNACADNTATNTGANSSLIKEIFNNFPTIYTEIDDNNNFTRFYFTTTTEVEGVSTTINADINLIYPADLKVTEPDDYIDMSVLLSGVMGNVVEGVTPTVAN